VVKVCTDSQQNNKNDCFALWLNFVKNHYFRHICVVQLTLLPAADVQSVVGCWVSCCWACIKVSIGWFVWCSVAAFCKSRPVHVTHIHNSTANVIIISETKTHIYIEICYNWNSTILIQPLIAVTRNKINQNYTLNQLSLQLIFLQIL